MLTGITEPILDWGCRKAGRPRSAGDFVVPLACPPLQPDGTPALQAARARWLERGISPDRFVLCFFGALGAQFDFATVLEAASLLEREAHPAQFVLCGEGAQLARLQAHAANHPNVVAPGWVGQAEIQALMHLAKGGLAPYFNETSFTLSVPNKVIEYLSGGLPVLSSLRGVTAALLAAHDCGRTYAERSPEALADAVRRLASEEERRVCMGARGRALFEDRFTAERAYGAMIDRLLALAGAPGAPG